jgi:hypothetical protein
VKRVLEASPRWNRQRLAVLEAADFDLKRLFAVLYLVSSTSALIYMVGWLRFNFLDLPEGPLSNGSMIALALTSIAGVLQAAMLPAVAVALGVERLMQRRIGHLDRPEARLKGHHLPEQHSMPNYAEVVGGAHGQYHHMQSG